MGPAHLPELNHGHGKGTAGSVCARTQRALCKSTHVSCCGSHSQGMQACSCAAASARPRRRQALTARVLLCAGPAAAAECGPADPRGRVGGVCGGRARGGGPLHAGVPAPAGPGQPQQARVWPLPPAVLIRAAHRRMHACCWDGRSGAAGDHTPVTKAGLPARGLQTCGARRIAVHLQPQLKQPDSHTYIRCFRG